MRRRHFILSVALLFALQAPLSSDDLVLPLRQDSLRIAIIGDSGTGDKNQYRVAQQLAAWRSKFPFTMVLMLGDNLYGGESPRDYERKFEHPYQPLLDASVKFYAALGNHDDSNQRFYKNFNMNGERFYTFRPKPGIRFFALDSNNMDRAQLEWLGKELKGSESEWKICFFHHPIYSSGGRHGSDVQLRAVLEPLFVEHGVSVVFAGHEHFYERLKPQKGISYFISGGAGKLRRSDIEEGALTAKGFDQGYHFMLVEFAGDDMYFQVLSDTGKTVDSGSLRRRGALAGGALTPATSKVSR